MTDARRVLVPLIRKALKGGEVAAHNAAKPYYRTAGEKMLEAMPQFTALDDFYSWVRRNFKIGREQAIHYMKLANMTAFKALYEAQLRKGIDDFRRRHFADKPSEPIKQMIDEAAKAAKAAEPNGKMQTWQAQYRERAKEMEAERRLTKQVFDAGYKALATKLHPDKGGSPEEMTRLNRVRDQLRTR
jgi:hypothetical protein